MSTRRAAKPRWWQQTWARVVVVGTAIVGIFSALSDAQKDKLLGPVFGLKDEPKAAPGKASPDDPAKARDGRLMPQEVARLAAIAAQAELKSTAIVTTLDDAPRGIALDLIETLREAGYKDVRHQVRHNTPEFFGTTIRPVSDAVPAWAIELQTALEKMKIEPVKIELQRAEGSLAPLEIEVFHVPVK